MDCCIQFRTLSIGEVVDGNTRTVWAVQVRNPWRSADAVDSFLGQNDPRWSKCEKVERELMGKKDGKFVLTGEKQRYHRHGNSNNEVDTSIVDGIAWYLRIFISNSYCTHIDTANLTQNHFPYMFFRPSSCLGSNGRGDECSLID